MSEDTSPDFEQVLSIAYSATALVSEYCQMGNTKYLTDKTTVQHFGGGYHVYEISKESLVGFKKVIANRSPSGLVVVAELLSGALRRHPRIRPKLLLHQAYPTSHRHEGFQNL